MDDNITHIFLEGNGGGTYQESYQNALYYFAHRTSCDAFEKRGKKGYLVLIGDEMAYPRSTKAELDALIGDGAQSDATLDEIMAAVLEKWEVFFIIPAGTNHYSDPSWSSSGRSTSARTSSSSKTLRRSARPSAWRSASGGHGVAGRAGRGFSRTLARTTPSCVSRRPASTASRRATRSW